MLQGLLHSGVGLTRRLSHTVDCLGHRKDLLLEFPSFCKITFFHGPPGLGDNLWDASSKTDQSTVNAHVHRGKQVLIVARENSEVRGFPSQQSDISLVDGHLTCAHLQGLYVGDLGEFDDRFHRIEGLCRVRIEVDNDTDVDGRCHIREKLHDPFLLHTEPKPVVRRHHEDSICSGFLGILCVFDRLQSTLG